MGWSCSCEAAEAADRIAAACRASTGGNTNTIRVGRVEYFHEHDNIEHGDGAITGTVYLVLTREADGRAGRCRQVARYRIEPDGTVSSGPAWFVAAASPPRPVAKGRRR